MTTTTTIGGHPALLLERDGSLVGDGLSPNELLGDLMGSGTRTVVAPRERLAPALFDLRSGVAGQIHQRLVTYGMRMVVTGDISDLTNASRSLRDDVRECHRGADLRFVTSLPEDDRTP